MNFSIITEYPFWFIIFCLALGILYSAILYYKDKSHDFSLWLLRIMAFFRFISISLIAFLLLSPLIKTIFHTSEKPVIIIAQDNSQSILTTKDSLFYKDEYVKKIKDLTDKLNKEYEVRTYSFGDKISNDLSNTFSDKQTDIASLFDELLTRYSNRNVGAVIMASDGIYNKGLNPLYSSGKIMFPVYTIALGDTNIQKDIILTKVNFNRIAYLGNDFPLEIIVNANKCKGLNSSLVVSKGREVLFSKNINFTNNHYFETIRLQIEAKETGLQRYRINLSPVEHEISISNNIQDIFIDILDVRQKILILANSPHPDITALKQALESNYNYEVEDFIIDKFNKPISQYNLVILHQLPSFEHPSVNLIQELKNSDIPVLYIVGSQTNISLFNNLKTGISIIAKRNSYNEALPVLNNDFTLFTISDKTKKIISYFPPLISPFGNYKMLNSVNILFNQKIGSIKTKDPLILFNQNLDTKIGVIVGEGIWKWRLTNFAKENNHNAFNEIISKTIQYLSVKLDKSFFRIFSKNNFVENELVEFDAEVYNESYELINEPEINFTIINSDNKRFPFTFNKTASAYYLNAGSFPVDNYKYIARVKTGDKILQDKGEFTVSALNIETINTIADHNLLYKLAEKHNGKMIYPQHLDKLFNMIKEREDIKTVSYSQKRYNELINIYWVFFAIIVLLTAEWFMRKRGGGY
ncbi:MAG: hypothetical protein K8R58_05225 [Bacteroidales bacterium]|nr:hypothetical protein [Bacteroidales bacterium]